MNVIVYFSCFPSIFLCYFIYFKDKHKEPKGLLIKIFLRGVLTCIPVVFLEVILTMFFPIDNSTIAFPILFINVFISVALVEEGAKWIVTKYIGYKNRDFDEIYDIIVYSVFASLGFACLENISYVFQNGVANAISRGITSIPGHASFGIMMGYFFAKARINEKNNNERGTSINIVLSLIVPALLHTIYDTILLGEFSIVLFFIFDITMVVICYRLVNKMCKVQINVSTNNSVLNTNITFQQINHNYSFCPMCGKINHYN